MEEKTEKYPFKHSLGQEQSPGTKKVKDKNTSKKKVPRKNKEPPAVVAVAVAAAAPQPIEVRPDKTEKESTLKKRKPTENVQVVEEAIEERNSTAMDEDNSSHSPSTAAQVDLLFKKAQKEFENVEQVDMITEPTASLLVALDNIEKESPLQSGKVSVDQQERRSSQRPRRKASSTTKKDGDALLEHSKDQVSNVFLTMQEEFLQISKEKLIGRFKVKHSSWNSGQQANKSRSLSLERVEEQRKMFNGKFMKDNSIFCFMILPEYQETVVKNTTKGKTEIQLEDECLHALDGLTR